MNMYYAKSYRNDYILVTFDHHLCPWELFSFFSIRKLPITWKLQVRYSCHFFTAVYLSRIKLDLFDIDFWPGELQLIAAHRFVLPSHTSFGRTTQLSVAFVIRMFVHPSVRLSVMHSRNPRLETVQDIKTHFMPYHTGLFPVSGQISQSWVQGVYSERVR